MLKAFHDVMALSSDPFPGWRFGLNCIPLNLCVEALTADGLPLEMGSLGGNQG